MSDDTPIPLCDCCLMSAGRLRRAHWVLLLLFSGALFLVNLGRARALTKHEVLLAAVAKRMVQDREWVLLRIGDEYFLESGRRGDRSPRPPTPPDVLTVSGGFL